MNSLWKRFQFTRNQQRPPLKQSLRSQLNSNCTFSYDRDICRFVVLVILFRSFDWTEQRMTPSLVTVYDQRVSPDNGCACAIVILPDVLGCLICMIGQMRPGYGNWFQSISMVWRNRWMVGTPEFWPFLETEDEIFCYGRPKYKVECRNRVGPIRNKFVDSKKSNRGRSIRVQLILLYNSIRQGRERPIVKLLSGVLSSSR